MDESNLTPSEQVQLGIFKAMAGNQMDGEIAYTLSKSPFGNWAPRPKPVPAPVPYESVSDVHRRCAERNAAEYAARIDQEIANSPDVEYVDFDSSHWTPELERQLNAAPNDFTFKGYTKAELLRGREFSKTRRAKENARRAEEDRERQKADAAEAERKGSFGYQFWHRLWNAIFSGFTLGLFLAFFGAWLTLCLWDKPVHGALAGLACAALYGFFKPIR